MASNVKTNRDCTRIPKCSILLSNVLGITLTSSSLDTDQRETTDDPKNPQQYTGQKLFDSFIDENKSTLHSRLNESLLEIRFAGWIQPFTLLIKGPLEELDVIKEAWRRRFLRSPSQFTIREIGTVKSIDTEIVQQAPFLPLTKAVYEAIAALNQNKLPSYQQNVFEYLAHTYQYVHVPKPHVIRDCLGILFKEGKVYSSTSGEYFVLVNSDSEKSENKGSKVAREKTKENTARCIACEESHSTHAQNKRNSRSFEHAHSCDKHRHGEKKAHKKSSNTSRDTSKESKDSNKKIKKDNNLSIAEHSSTKKPKDNACKKTVWGQISCFIRGKNVETSQNRTKDEKRANRDETVRDSKTTHSLATDKPIEPSTDPVKPVQKQVQVEEEKNSAVKTDKRQLERTAEQFQRSRSFVAPSKTRPEFIRSSSFTANGSRSSTRAIDCDIIQTRPIELNTVPVKPEHTEREKLHQTFDPSRQNRNNACAVGIVRPWNTSRAESRPVSRASSMRESTSRKPIVTPNGDLNKPVVLRENKNLTRSFSVREYRRSADCTPLPYQRNYDVFDADSPLKRLLTKNTGNTLPIAPEHPSYIPAPGQDRSRQVVQKRNSFPAAMGSSFNKKPSWRATPLRESYYDEYENNASKEPNYHEVLKRYDDVFSPTNLHQNHLSQRVTPCDCSDAGYSEHCERKSASSDQHQNSFTSKHKHERSSICSTSDNGILLDEISSSGSSEIQSIMNHEKKLNNADNPTYPPYSVAKGEVVLDSSLTFIGII